MLMSRTVMEHFSDNACFASVTNAFSEQVFVLIRDTEPIDEIPKFQDVFRDDEDEDDENEEPPDEENEDEEEASDEDGEEQGGDEENDGQSWAIITSKISACLTKPV